MTKTDRQELAFGVTAPMLIAALGFWAWGIEGAIAALLFVIIITTPSRRNHAHEHARK